MQALSFDRKGDLAALTLIEAPKPVPAGDEVLVQIKAAGVNPSDVKNVRGFFPYTTLPRIPGRDFAGVVVEGPAAWRGRRVYGTGFGLGFSQNGSHAEFLALPASGCAEIPSTMSFAQAAACGVPYATAWDGLKRAGLGPGKKLLVIGANGAVGRAALALGKAAGAQIVAAARREEAIAELSALGFATLRLGEAETLPAQLAEAFGGGADLIFETTGAWLPACVKAANPHGAICVIAPPGMGQLSVDFPVLDFYRRGLTLIGVNSLLHNVTASAGLLDELAPWFESSALAPPPEPEQRPLIEGQAAFAEIDMGYGQKIVLLP